MRLGIISDTRGHFDKAEEEADFFYEKNCEKEIHCGDMICPATADTLDRGFDFYAVRVNKDGGWDLKDSVEYFGERMGNIGELEVEGLKIALYHGKDEGLADGLAKSWKYDYVFLRRTHSKIVREDDETVQINPGGAKLPFQEEKIHVYVFDHESEEFEFHRIEV